MLDMHEIIPKQKGRNLLNSLNNQTMNKVLTLIKDLQEERKCILSFSLMLINLLSQAAGVLQTLF